MPKILTDSRNRKIKKCPKLPLLSEVTPADGTQRMIQTSYKNRLTIRELNEEYSCVEFKIFEFAAKHDHFVSATH